MATQSVIHPHEQSKSPSVIPFPSSTPAEPVTQLELSAFLSLRNRARQLTEQIETAEISICARLAAGAGIEEGEHTAEMVETFRRNVSWRSICERLGNRLYGHGKGKPYCEKVLRSTKPTRSVGLDVQ